MNPDLYALPRYPGVVVPLSACDGNAFAVLGMVERTLARAGVSRSEIAAFRAEATSGSYDNLLVTVMRWVNAE